MWARGISEFGAIVILAYNPKTISVLTWELFSGYGLSVALPVTALLILIALVILVIFRLLLPSRRRAAAGGVDEDSAGGVMLKLTDLAVDVGGFGLRLDSLEVVPGEYLVILGPNGAGKTVLLETIAGLHAVAAGRVEFLSEAADPHVERRHRLVAGGARGRLRLPGLPAVPTPVGRRRTSGSG